MEILKIATYAGIGILALGTATLALPRHVEIERSAVIPAAPAAVLSLAASGEGYQAFNPYKTEDPALKIEQFGPASGVGSGFHFDGKGGKGSQTVAAITDNTVTYAIDMGAMGQPTQSITALPVADGTKVTWRVQSDLGFNPVFRVFGLFMDGMMGKTLEQGLENIAGATA